MISQKAFANEFERLAAAFPCAPVRSLTLSIYHQALADFEPQDLRAAVDEAIASWEWAQALPPVAKLREWAADAARPRLERERRRAELERQARAEREAEEARNDPQVIDCRARIRQMLAGVKTMDGSGALQAALGGASIHRDNGRESAKALHE